MGRSPRSAIYRAGGVIVPLNTRFKGNEAAFILDDAQVEAAVHRRPTSSTPTTSPCCETRMRRRALEHDRRPARRDRAGTTSRGPTSSRRAIACRSTTSQAREASAHRRRPSPTSCSRRARRAGRRARCSRTAASVARLRRVVDRRRAARRRSLPHRQPVLPHVRTEGRHPREPRQRVDDRARTRCSTSTR